MRVGILVNAVGARDGTLTTYLLAADLHRSGHEVWVFGCTAMAFESGRVLAFARRAPGRRFRSSQRYLDAIDGPDAVRRWIQVGELDLLLLRMNPFALKSWALNAALDFARLAAEAGVCVLNDPVGLARATSKLYLETFPADVRPPTLIARSPRRIERFLEEHGQIVLKPLRGYGGRNVFQADGEDRANLDQIVKAVARDGYIVAQRYLQAAIEGDTRLFLVDGQPLVHEGRYAVVCRRRAEGDVRSNVHAGGTAVRGRIDDTLLRLAERVRPRLVADGMFFVALDVAGDKLLEINVFSPGGLSEVQQFEGVDFTHAITAALEERVARRG